MARDWPRGSSGVPLPGVLRVVIRLALIEGAPEPTCRKMLEGREEVPKVEESRGGLRTDLRTAEIPRSVPARRELSVVRCLVLVWDIK